MWSVQAIVQGNPVGFGETVEKIRLLGTDNLSHFKNGYKVEGGYSLQQNPDELAALALALRRLYTPKMRYLEIGSASGGTMRFLHEEVGFERIVMIDDHGHHRWPEQDKHILAVLDGPHPPPMGIGRHVLDSHTDAAKTALDGETAARTVLFDIAFVDGDHRYAGVTQDIQLVLPYVKKGGFVLLHDTVACPGDVGRAWKEAQERRQLEPVAEFIGAEVPLGIAVGRVV